ncbi:hypothetical protein PsYK624_166280 [Phanerochaete sordida]|uniref:T6SS Phospholipase effector Tle1-like catalytic domain-containing protein n=1 Tax=Phanerochaete sordida TaxID=48140 RepID=A0A9P3GRU3_9APHY|nr:hypothetical protein PsYK624_166280 [Phanerochaete sordida]
MVFKRTLCQSVLVQIVGVWNTFSSVGLLRSTTLTCMTTNTTIRPFLHALLLDERRCTFQPNLYRRLIPDASFIVPYVSAVPDNNTPMPAMSDVSFDEEDKRRR